MLREAQSGFSQVFDIPCMCPSCQKTEDQVPKVTHFSDVTRLETPPSLNRNNQECFSLVELSYSCEKYRVIKSSMLQTRIEGLTGDRKWWKIGKAVKQTSLENWVLCLTLPQVLCLAFGKSLIFSLFLSCFYGNSQFK